MVKYIRKINHVIDVRSFDPHFIKETSQRLILGQGITGLASWSKFRNFDLLVDVLLDLYPHSWYAGFEGRTPVARTVRELVKSKYR